VPSLLSYDRKIKMEQNKAKHNYTKKGHATNVDAVSLPDQLKWKGTITK